MRDAVVTAPRFIYRWRSMGLGSGVAGKTHGAARGVVPALAVAHFLAFVDRFLIAATAPVLAVRFQLSDWWLGVLLGPAFAVPYGIAAILFGRRADRGYARGFVLAGVAIWTLASAWIAFSPNAATLFAGRAILGLGQAAFVPAALVLILGRAGEARRPRALAIFTIGSSAGRSAGLLIAGATLAATAALGIAVAPDGWRWLFLVTALPNVLLFAFLARVIPRPSPAALPGSPTQPWRPKLPAAIFMAGAIAPILIGQSVAAWLPILLARGHDLSTADASVIAGVLTLASAPCGQILGGVVIARSVRARTHPGAVVAGALLLACIPLLVASVATALISVALCMAAFNMVAGIASFAGLFGVQALMPAARRGTGNGVFIAIVTLVGVGGGPALTGLFSTMGQRSDLRSLDRAIVATAAIAVAIALVAAIANRTRYPRAVSAVAA